MYALIVLGLAGCVTLTSSQDTPPQLANLSSSIHQAVMVDPLPSSRATVTAWERNGRGWRQVFKPTAAMVGRNGVAPLNEKREGDGRTPSGIYAIGTAFGYAPAIHTKLPYRQATENDFWVDDVSSPQYNRWVTGKPNASSFEEMRRSDDLYKYGAVIEYNTDPIIPGNGSAIFVHIWRGPDTATAGCVAVPEPQLRSLLKWLDAASQPVIILKSL
jgi:L,D-peptidoglycan transpeptidase YkuD (ErfK/YbiS/YcfS/YnhG family)